MSEPIRRIAISLGGGYVPGLGSVVRALARSAQHKGWEVLGIRGGFDGLLCPERYADGGVITIDADAVCEEGSLLGTGPRIDPFRMQLPSAEGFIEEVDASERILDRLREERIDALVGIVGGSAVTGAYALSVLWKLSRKGLPCVCIPKSVENDLFATAQPFGYDSILAYTTQMLSRIRIAARDQGRVALVELPGQYAGWLALDAGLAAGADVILIPERAYHVASVARHIDAHPDSALILVAEGAHADGLPEQAGHQTHAGYSGSAVIQRAGRVLRQVHEEIQRCSGREIFPLLLDQLVRAGEVTATDRILGAGYAVSAVDALADGKTAHLLAARDADFVAVPLADAVNRVRTIEPKAAALVRARALGICLGESA